MPRGKEPCARKGRAISETSMASTLDKPIYLYVILLEKWSNPVSFELPIIIFERA